MKEYKGLEVIVNSRFTLVHGIAVAGFAIREEGGEVIVVDHHFAALSKDAQEFVLAHEYGHYQDEGLNLKEDGVTKRLELLEIGEVYRDEAVADDYAMGVVGYSKSVKALKEVKEQLSEFASKETTDEINLRIKRLKRNQSKKRLRDVLSKGILSKGIDLVRNTHRTITSKGVR